MRNNYTKGKKRKVDVHTLRESGTRRYSFIFLVQFPAVVFFVLFLFCFLKFSKNLPDM